MFTAPTISTRRSGARLRVEALRAYLAGLGVVAAGTAISLAGAPVLQTAAFIVVFPMGLVIVTARCGVGPAVLAAVAGVLAFDFIFVPPAFAFAVPNLKDGLTLVVMLLMAAIACVFAEQLRAQAQRAESQADVERLRNALLSALSHDLRTPLGTLLGAGTALCDDRLGLEERRACSRAVADEARHLSRLVASLLELTRLEAGRVSRAQDPQAIDEVIGAALHRFERQLEGRAVRTDVPESTPLAAFDPVLIEHVLVNLIENVLRHAGSTSPIDVEVEADAGAVVVAIADRGPGVCGGDEERVFQRFYRGRHGRPSDTGSGLGLTICRAIVQAHGGRIWLENRTGGGAVVRFTLPVARDVGLGALRGSGGLPELVS